MGAKPTCPYCGKSVDKKIEQFEKFKNRVYHLECLNNFKQTLLEREELINFINTYYTSNNVQVAWPVVGKQIKQYVEEYGYSYKMIKYALYYFYVIKCNPISKSKGNIGIVPYIYNEALEYYNKTQKIKQMQEKDNRTYQKEEKVVKIRLPKTKPLINLKPIDLDTLE